MIQKYRPFRFLLIALFSITLIVVPFTGCKTSLQPGGVYQDNTILYNADRTIVDSYEILDRFVGWEHSNRTALAAYPQVTAAADNIRDNARRWLESAIRLREAYAKAPTGQNKDALLNSINVLKQALAEASRYMAKPLNQHNP